MKLRWLRDGPDCNRKSKKGSKNEFKDSMPLIDSVDCPATPIGVREKKFKGVTGKGNETETSSSGSEISVFSGRRITRSCSRLLGKKVEVGMISLNKPKGRELFKGVREKKFKGVTGKGNEAETSFSGSEISVFSERRITRSCSRLLGRKVEVGMISQDKPKGRDLLNNQGCESKTRKVLGSVQPAADRLGGEVKGKSCGNGKENISDSCKGSKINNSVSVSRCVNRRGQRGRRNNPVDDHGGEGKTDDTCKQTGGNSERRITRSVSKQVGRVNELYCQTTRMAGKSESIQKQEGSGSINGTELRKTRQCGSINGTELRKTRQCGSMLSTCVVEKESDDCAKEDVRGRRETRLTGVKRRRKQEGLQGDYQGWTREQEVALHKAYFTAKPSPDFWKKVAKLVPGKSAQECFDKVHSDNQTPLCSKPSSRVKKQNSPSDLLVSSGELFKSVETKSKRPCKNKSKSQVARKTVRQLLQKYSHVNQDNEADLFSVLEPSANYSDEALQLNAVQLTPKQLLRSPDLSSKSWDRSSGQKKHLSRFSDRSSSHLTSPPVLKKVKNMALHEKYIDHLHVRENKRTAAFSRCIKSARNQRNSEENSVHMKDAVKAAKDALVFDAKDAIDRFQQSQANIMEGYSDSEEFQCSDDDEDETVL